MAASHKARYKACKENDQVYRAYYPSGIGLIEITGMGGAAGGILTVEFMDDAPAAEAGPCCGDAGNARNWPEAARNLPEAAQKFQEAIRNIQEEEAPQYLRECVKQLDEYFKGMRKEFDLKLLLRGTAFQMKVWEKLREIPYGKTASYKDIAEAVGSPAAVRAVGGANNKNRISIIIPCHRVIGSSGKLIGYGGGLWRKEWLLDHEKNYSENH